MCRRVCQKPVILLEIVNLLDARSAHLYIVFVPELHSALILPNLGFQKDFFYKGRSNIWYKRGLILFLMK